MSPGLRESRWYLFKVFVVFAAPVVVLVAIMDVVPFLLALYALLVLYGLALTVIFLSRIRPVGSIVRIRNNDLDDPQYYGDMGRARALAISVGSGSSVRHPSDSSRREIAKIIGRCMEKYYEKGTPSQITEMYDALGPELSRDLEGVLSPYEWALRLQSGRRRPGDDGVRDGGEDAGADESSAARADSGPLPVTRTGGRSVPALQGVAYLSSLERVVSKLDDREKGNIGISSPSSVSVG
jgi:hypothetical protein